MIQRLPPTDWEELIAVEPRLRAVECRARLTSVPPGCDPDWREWSNIKSMFDKLVGWNAERPDLSTSEVYDLAYQHLLDVWEIGE